MGLVAFCHVKAVVVSLVLLSYVKLWQLRRVALCCVTVRLGVSGYGSYGESRSGAFVCDAVCLGKAVVVRRCVFRSVLLWQSRLLQVARVKSRLVKAV